MRRLMEYLRYLATEWPLPRVRKTRMRFRWQCPYCQASHTFNDTVSLLVEEEADAETQLYLGCTGCGRRSLAVVARPACVP